MLMDLFIQDNESILGTLVYMSNSLSYSNNINNNFSYMLYYS